MVDKTSHALKIAEERTYVVYDGRDGRIRHVHRTTTFEGAEAPSQKEQEERAMALAERHGHQLEHLQVIAVGDLQDLKAGVRVDLQTNQLTHGTK